MLKVVNTFLHGQGMVGGKVIREVEWGYHFNSQLEETFYQGMRESLALSTYSISINMFGLSLQECT